MSHTPGSGEEPCSHKTGTFHPLAGSRVFAHMPRPDLGFFCQGQNRVWQHQVPSRACQNAPALPRRGQLCGSECCSFTSCVQVSGCGLVPRGSQHKPSRGKVGNQQSSPESALSPLAATHHQASAAQPDIN